MTRKTTRNYSLSVVAPFISVLTLLIAAAVLAQTSGAGQSSGKANAVFAPPGASASAQAERPLIPWTDGSGRFPVGRSQTKRHGAGPMDENPPLFLSAVTYDSGADYPYSVAVADVNGDGKLDLVVANDCFSLDSCLLSGSVSVLLGNGDGTFRPAESYDSGGGGAVSVAVADVNGDGKPDLVAANFWSGTVGVLLGKGDGTFQTAVAYGSGGHGSQSVAAADVNGDGKQDIVVANSGSDDNMVGVLLGNGDGTFQTATTYGSGGIIPYAIAVGDVNSDGKPDLLVANWLLSFQDPDHSTVGVLLGNGDGTFQAAAAFDSGGQLPYFVAVADVNGDGKLDLVTANCAPTGPAACPNNSVGGGRGVVGVLLGNGDGTFRSALTYDSGGYNATSVAVADVNSDGKPDLLVSNWCASECPQYNGEGNVVVLLGDGDGTFQQAVSFDSGSPTAWSVAVADVNADGRLDLVVANSFPNKLGVLLHNGTPVTLVSSLDPAAPHKVVTYTAAVTSQDGGAVTGTVMFEDGGSTIATVPLANNQAAYSTTYTKGGSHAITATYSGDAHNAGGMSATLMEYVASVVSKTVVTTSGSPSFVGQPVTFTATVTSTHGTIPDGELVTFYDGTTTLGSVALASGTAAYTTSALSGKTHTIKATYGGDATFEPSTGRVAQVVNKYPTTTALSSSPNPSAHGQAVTFTATVTPTGPNMPTGKVLFKDGTLGIGSATLSGGVATITKSKLAVGTHPITAQYLGDTVSAKSTSSVLNQVVQ